MDRKELTKQFKTDITAQNENLDEERILKEKIEKLTNFWLSNYNPTNPKNREKAFHDPIWGTNVLSPAEVAILDSPILQRLRFIHQTSFAYYTYPSANHTRLEHSIGVMSVATRMAEALNRKKTAKILDDEKHNINSTDYYTVRLAALLHDCGQGLFSHVSEDYYKNHWLMKPLLKSKKYGNVKAHELLSYYIVKSEEFKKFFNEIIRKHYDENNLLEHVKTDSIAELIIGRGDNKKHHVAQIINGPFDSDKLDYIVRDSYFTGLKMTVDVERLFYAMNVAEFPKNSGKSCLVLDNSGFSALEQILSSKLLLYSRLYRHHKVRAADMMLRNYLMSMDDRWASIRDSYPEYNKKLENQKSEILFDTPVDYLRFVDYDFLNPETHSDQYLKNTVIKFRERKLPMRSLFISFRSIENKKAFELVDSIVSENWEAMQWQLQREIHNGIPGSMKPDVYDIIVDLPEPPKLNETEITPLQLNSKDEPELPKQIFKSQDWFYAYIANKWEGHVFCPAEPKELQNIVNKVAREVLQSTFRYIKFNKYADSLCKLDRQ